MGYARPGIESAIVQAFNGLPPGARLTIRMLASRVDELPQNVGQSVIALRAAGVLLRERIGRETWVWAARHPIDYTPARDPNRGRPRADAYPGHRGPYGARLDAPSATDEALPETDRDLIVPEGCDPPSQDAPVRVYRMGRLVGSRHA